MQTQSLSAFLVDAEQRALASGVAALPVEALRNQGGDRTPRKRAILARAAERARDAGLEAVPANF